MRFSSGQDAPSCLQYYAVMTLQLMAHPARNFDQSHYGVTRTTVTTIVAPDRKISFEAMFLGPHSCELPGVRKNKNAAFVDATPL